MSTESAKRWREAHPREASAYAKKWHEFHATYSHEYYISHRDDALAYQKEYNKIHKDDRGSYNKSYQAGHPDKMSVIHERRRIRKRGNGGIFTETEWKQAIAETDNRCVYCGRQYKRLTQDHVIPLTSGGRHDAGNIVPACRGCNAKKRNKSLLRFLYDRAA